MSPTNPIRQQAWRSVLIFLSLLTVFSTVFQYALVNLYPSSTYIGALMWCPAVAAFVTLRFSGRSIGSLPWVWPKGKWMWRSYLLPAAYVVLTYVLLWAFGFGETSNMEQLTQWAEELGLIGIGSLPMWALLPIAIVLVGTVGVVRSLATTLGEEIGWRGFFIYELRKLFSFAGVSLLSGLIWALWHWPIIVYYGDNVLLEFATFIVVIVAMSFMMTYYTFKVNSLWPAAVFHAVSNVYIQKILPQIVQPREGAAHWMGEFGIMFALVTFAFGLYYWRKGIKAGL